MSDTSLYAGLYEEMRSYAELVDSILIGLKEGSSSPNDADRQRLGNLLIQLAENRYDDLSSRLMTLILHDTGGTSQPELLRMGRALLSPQVDESVLGLLEIFAQSLERGQADALTRMRGWSR